MSPGLAIFKLAFQLSPIVLVDGIATDIAGGILPIIALTEAAHFLFGLLSGAENIELDDFFAHFSPMPGGTLIDNQIATYPFANQTVAGNAIISQPLNLSMAMICPARDTLGYATKLATMIMLKQTLDAHSAKGGTFAVATPAYIYQNGIMTSMRDISNAASHQVQNTWQLDFTFPLLTVETAQQVQNSLMAKLTGGTQVSGEPAWSGVSNTVGASSSLAGPSLIPAAGGSVAAGTAPFSSLA